MTKESFAEWKKNRASKKAAEEEAIRSAKSATAAAGKLNGLSGRDLFTFNAELLGADDSDGEDEDEDWDLVAMRERTEREREEKEAERCAPFLSLVCTVQPRSRADDWMGPAEFVYLRAAPLL